MYLILNVIPTPFIKVKSAAIYTEYGLLKS